jgi:predicted porin
MKKTLVALAVLAAGSVTAAEVYNNEGVSTTLSGVAEVQFIDNAGFADKDLAIRLDDFDLTGATTVALSEDLSAVGAVSIGRRDKDEDLANSNDAVVDRTYVGFASTEMGTLTFGQQTTIYDDVGNDNSYEFGYALFDYKAIDKGTDVAKYVYDNGKFFLAIAHDLKESDTDETVTDGRIGVRTDALEVALYLSDYKNDGALATEANDESSFNLQANYTMDAFGFAASYGVVDTTISTVDVKTTYAQVNATYTVDTTTYALGLNTSDSDLSGVAGDRRNGVYANVTTKLAPSVKVYAEVGYADVDDSIAKEDLGYVAGMEVSF